MMAFQEPVCDSLALGSGYKQETAYLYTLYEPLTALPPCYACWHWAVSTNRRQHIFISSLNPSLLYPLLCLLALGGGYKQETAHLYILYEPPTALPLVMPAGIGQLV